MIVGDNIGPVLDESFEDTLAQLAAILASSTSPAYCAQFLRQMADEILSLQPSEN